MIGAALPMRVLMTADTVGGVWTYATTLAGALQAHGIEVHLATMGAPLTADQHRTIDALPNVTLHESSYRLEWMEDPWADVVEASMWLLGLERELRPDVVHLNSYCHGALPWRAPVLMVAHSCVFSWWEAVHGTEPDSNWDVYRREVGTGLRAANMVAAPTAALLERIEHFYGPLPQPQVIANGMEPPEGGTPRKGPLVFSAGRVWDEAKNIIALCEAAEGLAWPVCVAGEATHPNGHPDCGFPGVNLLGRIPHSDVQMWMRRASIYALPALYEPFGLSILEAANAGCALVLGDIPSLREVWEDAAIYVPPREPRVLHRALTELIAKPHLCAELSTRAHQRARCYTASRMAESYHNLYLQLIRGRGGYRPTRTVSYFSNTHPSSPHARVTL